MPLNFAMQDQPLAVPQTIHGLTRMNLTRRLKISRMQDTAGCMHPSLFQQEDKNKDKDKDKNKSKKTTPGYLWAQQEAATHTGQSGDGC